MDEQVGEDATRGIGQIIVAMRPVIDRIASASTGPTLEPPELRQEAGRIEQLDSMGVQRRQGVPVDRRLRLARRPYVMPTVRKASVGQAPAYRSPDTSETP